MIYMKTIFAYWESNFEIIINIVDIMTNLTLRALHMVMDNVIPVSLDLDIDFTDNDSFIDQIFFFRHKFY